jgi:hypothetical protein
MLKEENKYLDKLKRNRRYNDHTCQMKRSFYEKMWKSCSFSTNMYETRKIWMLYENWHRNYTHITWKFWGSHSGGYEEFYLLGYLWKVNRRFGGTRSFHYHWTVRQARNQHEALLSGCFMNVSFLAYPSTLKMDAICASEISVDCCGATRRYIAEDITPLVLHVINIWNCKRTSHILCKCCPKGVWYM